MVIAANLGFPRIGKKRELKKAMEAYWKGASTEAELQSVAASIRKENWLLQQNAGIQHIPSNDFSLYDQMLDMTATVGAIPERYNFSGDNVDTATFFAMARGTQTDKLDVPAMEMTKWFDTNYHYLVPEFTHNQSFRLTSTKVVDQFKEAKTLGVDTRPVIIGPVTYLLLGKMKDGETSTLTLLDKLLPVYEQLLSNLKAAGAEWIQIDEPYLVMDLDDAARAAYTKAYEFLAAKSDLKFQLTTYFGDLRDNAELALSLPAAAIHVDLVRAPEQLDAILAKFPANKTLSLGVINGRNIWKADLDVALSAVTKAVDALGQDRVIVAPSCSLMHSPVDLALETSLDDELKGWLAFATQKLDEIVAVARAASGDKASVASAFSQSAAASASRKTSSRIHNDAVKSRIAALTPAHSKRNKTYLERSVVQRASLKLPSLPTTTIGSFPQTQEVRKQRAAFKKGDITRAQYDAFLESETEKCVRFQEEIDIDVLVHGEFERNDMVEYFGEKLDGFAFTKFGWVQSYGSRCVKPPVIFGDVSRPKPMTVRWSSFAQSLTERAMKGMLTGPVTILQWSFVRDDQPRSETTRQIALAIRDEVVDLESAGIKVIQIDEPAFREGLPLRKTDWKAYLDWAAESFRISSSGVKDSTQIHTHMCYSEFNDIIAAIAALDADVISIETSRSQMELLDAFVNFKYPNEIGPGVYDIHSPRVPAADEMVFLLHKALEVLTPQQVWVNPDCGLKTRGWDETRKALEELVDAAKTVRSELAEGLLKTA